MCALTLLDLDKGKILNTSRPVGYSKNLDMTFNRQHQTTLKPSKKAETEQLVSMKKKVSMM